MSHPPSAGLAAVQAQRDTLLRLLREVLAHEHLTNRLGEAVILLPAELTTRIREALR